VPHLAGSSKLLRAMNSGAALSLLFERGRLTRGELREATGLSKPTVSDAMRRLVEADLAIVDGHVVGGPGPNAEIYAINPDAAHAVAVSVREGADGPSVAAARCDLTGAVRANLHRPAPLRGGDPIRLVETVIRDLGRGLPGRLAQVQLGVAGSVDPNTRTIHHVDLPGFDAPGLVDALADRVGVPVELDNDVNLATIAERRHGVAQGADGFVLLWLGEGIGLGIDLGGTLLRGARGGAGEIGYVPLGLDPRPVRPERSRSDNSRAAGARAATPRPDLQSLVGGEAVRALAREYGHPDAVLYPADPDPGFVAALADRVAVALALVVAVLDPALLVLAGPVGQAGGPDLRDAVMAALRRAAPLEATVEVTTVKSDPVVAGALHAALTTTRNRLITNLA
jgi:predicted NBD/HSP70 family sugar kinase